VNPIGISTAELRANLGRRCGTLNDRASSCGGGQHAYEQYAREDQGECHGHDDQKCRGAALTILVNTAVGPIEINSTKPVAALDRRMPGIIETTAQ
jgi:hypothetical protein